MKKDDSYSFDDIVVIPKWLIKLEEEERQKERRKLEIESIRGRLPNENTA